MSKHVMSASCQCGARFHLENNSLYGFVKSERHQFSVWRDRHAECCRPATVNIDRAIIISPGPSFADLAREGSRKMFDAIKKESTPPRRFTGGGVLKVK